jgi:hypothetical protein
MGIDYERILMQFEDIQPAALDERESLRLENAYLRKLIETQKEESRRLNRLLRTNFTDFKL